MFNDDVVFVFLLYEYILMAWAVQQKDSPRSRFTPKVPIFEADKIRFLRKFPDRCERASAPRWQTKSMLFHSVHVIEGGTEEVRWPNGGVTAITPANED